MKLFALKGIVHTWNIEPLGNFMDLAQAKLVEADMRGEIEKSNDG